MQGTSAFPSETRRKTHHMLACLAANPRISVALAEVFKTNLLKLRNSRSGDTIVCRGGEVPALDPLASKCTALYARRKRKLSPTT